MAWASRSRLKPFVRAARTIRKHFDGIVAYFQERLTNGIVEGFNNKLRMIACRAFGFHTPPPLIAMLYLCCGGTQLNPPLPGPTQSAGEAEKNRRKRLQRAGIDLRNVKRSPGALLDVAL